MVFRIKWSVYIYLFGVRNSEEFIVLFDFIWIDLIFQDFVDVEFFGIREIKVLKVLIGNSMKVGQKWIQERWEINLFINFS